MNARVLLQYILPHRLLSAIVRRATHWRLPAWKNFLIRRFVRRYAVDMQEAEQPDPLVHAHFNAFFTRALKPGARPIEQEPGAVVCPSDGRISQSGVLRDGRILQAKGQYFSCAELLGDAAAATPYAHGGFTTIYLAPRDYHRVHMPCDGQLDKTVHVPGRLFSVAPFAVRGVPRLFARNERLVCHFRDDQGPFVVVLVGAMLVSGIQTVWNGQTVPPYARAITTRDWSDQSICLARGDEMARFNMGSTVIVLTPTPYRTDDDADPDRRVQVGQLLGRRS